VLPPEKWTIKWQPTKGEEASFEQPPPTEILPDVREQQMVVGPED